MHQFFLPRFVALVFICLALLLGCGGGSPASNPPIQNGPILDQLQVSLSDTTLPKGVIRQLNAIGIYPDKTNEDFTNQVSWRSGNDSVLSVDSEGVLTAKAPGNTVVTATYGGQTAALDIVVTNARLSSISIAPRGISLPQNIVQQLAATGTYSDGSIHDVSDEITWGSSDNTVVTVSAQGQATAVGLGNATVSASIRTIRDSIQIAGTTAALVDIEITEQNPTLPLGTHSQLGALGIFSDGSTQDITPQVNWSSADENIATLSTQGLLSSQSVGTTTLIASYSSIDTSTSVTITNEELTSIEIVPSQINLPAGTEVQLGATGVYTTGTTRNLTNEVTWQSGDSSTATVSNATQTAGLLTATSTGNTTVSAHLGTASATTPVIVSTAILQAIAISPSNVSIAPGTHQTFTAIGNYSDGSTQDITDQVAWAPTDIDIANNEDGDGKFVSYTAGLIQVIANLDNVFAFTNFTVTTATLDTITLSPTNETIPKGVSISYTATGTYSDASTQDISELVTWNSSDSGKASISNINGNRGNATGVLEGTTTITASHGPVSGNTSLTVSGASLTSISVTAAYSSMTLGTDLQFIATGNYSDASTHDVSEQVTWDSSDTGIVTVSNADGDRGTVSAQGVGIATIAASFNGFSADTDINVVDTPNAPRSLSISATPNAILNNDSDSTTIDIVVQANSPTGVIADGTEVYFEIVEDTQVTSQTYLTSNGVISLPFTSDYDGFIPFRATLTGTNISATGALVSTPNFAKVFLRGGFMEPQYSEGVYLIDSVFSMYIVNFSNRVFNINEYQLKNGGELFLTIPASIFNEDGKLDRGEPAVVNYALSQNRTDNGVSAQFNLSDPVTTEQFSILGTYIYSP